MEAPATAVESSWICVFSCSARKLREEAIHVHASIQSGDLQVPLTVSQRNPGLAPCLDVRVKVGESGFHIETSLAGRSRNHGGGIGHVYDR